MAITSTRPGIPPALAMQANGYQLNELKAISVHYQYGINRIPWMEIVLSSDDGVPENHDNEVQLCMPGSSFTLSIQNGETLFDGFISRLSRSTNTSRSELKLLVRNPLQRLTVLHRSQVFEEKTDMEIINSFFNEHSIRADSISGLNVKHPQMVQFRCSDWQFILSRLKANGVWLIPQTGNIRIEEPKLATSPNHVMRLKCSNATGSEGTTRVDIDEAFWRLDISDLPGGLEIASWDLRQQKSNSAKAEVWPLGTQVFDVKNQKSLVNSLSSVTRSTPFQPGEMEAMAKGLLLDQHLNSIVTRFSVSGAAIYSPGQTLELTESGSSFDGKGIITSVENFIVQGVWTTTIETGLRDPWNDIYSSNVPRAPGTYIGVVESLQHDPDGLDRFRVRIPALLQDNKPLWARFSTPYAGKSYGMYFYPSVGDEVSVMFFDEDPRFPVIINSMFNPKNPPPFTAGDTEPRGFVFDSSKKQQLIFDPHTGDMMLQSGEDSVVLNEGIALHSSKDLKIDSSGIKMIANRKVEMQGSGGLSFKGAKVELEP